MKGQFNIKDQSQKKEIINNGNEAVSNSFKDSSPVKSLSTQQIAMNAIISKKKKTGAIQSQ